MTVLDHASPTLPSPGPVHRAETEAFYREAIERLVVEMGRRLDEEFSLDHMAEVAIMSPFHLNRVFKQVTGVPPCRFLTALRLASAKRLLLDSEMSVTDVSLEVGYNSLGTFTRRFAELVGLAPSYFRRLSRKDAAAAMDRVRKGLAQYRPHSTSGIGPSGRVTVPEGFSGLIFVGLFNSAVPQTEPAACALLTAPGEYRLPRVADGAYHLFGLGLSWSSDPHDYLLYEDALRGGTANSAVVITGGRCLGATDLDLRLPEPIDPPILLALPLLLARRLAERGRRHAAARPSLGAVAAGAPS